MGLACCRTEAGARLRPSLRAQILCSQKPEATVLCHGSKHGSGLSHGSIGVGLCFSSSVLSGLLPFTTFVWRFLVYFHPVFSGTKDCIIFKLGVLLGASCLCFYHAQAPVRSFILAFGKALGYWVTGRAWTRKDRTGFGYQRSGTHDNWLVWQEKGRIHDGKQDMTTELGTTGSKYTGLTQILESGRHGQ